jgi:hypothetical protein
MEHDTEIGADRTIRRLRAEDRLDYGIERQRHDGFIGREGVLADLDRLLVENMIDHWVVVTGGPGMGKSAILAAWLARREAAGAVVPHHFIRRGFYGWDEPAKIVRSLAAQIEACYPAQRVPDAPPKSRLVDLLSRVSARELVPRGDRLVLLIDGLDEYDAPAGAYDPLAAFLPHALPRGVRLLCASRPRHPYVDALAARDGELRRLDLDDDAAAARSGAAKQRRSGSTSGSSKRRSLARMVACSTPLRCGSTSPACRSRTAAWRPFHAVSRHCSRCCGVDSQTTPSRCAGWASCARRASRSRSTNSPWSPAGMVWRRGTHS